MNETIKNFLKLLNIDEEKFNSLEGSRIKKDVDVNPILSRFALYKNQEDNKRVSIADVVGYNYGSQGLSRGLISNLSEFFDKDGDNYHSRSVSMLDIPQSKIMNELDYSFKREPICLLEVDKGVYNIGNNGLHRFHILKTHYLDELSKLGTSDKNAVKKLKEKYSFNANVSEIDYIKSYSAFMLKLLDKNLNLESHYDSNYELTGKSRLINYENPEDEIILTDDQLVEMVNKKYNQFLKETSKKEAKQIKEIMKESSKFESFIEFYDLALNQNQKGEREWN